LRTFSSRFSIMAFFENLFIKVLYYHLFWEPFHQSSLLWPFLRTLPSRFSIMAFFENPSIKVLYYDPVNPHTIPSIY
jgi:hypothetical protein